MPHTGRDGRLKFEVELPVAARLAQLRNGKILRYLRWKENPGFVKKLHCSAVSASGLTGLTLIQLFFAMKRD
jgi:hypothetical protein